MSNRRPLALSLCLTLAACAVGTQASIQAKQQKLDQLTRALSIEGNENIKKAAESLGTVNTAVSGPGFQRTGAAVGRIVSTGGGSLVASGGGNLVATGGGNLLGNNSGTLVATGGGNIVGTGGGSLVAMVAAIGGNLAKLGNMTPRRALLQQAGEDVRIELDRNTGELKRVWNSQASLRFSFTNNGKQRGELIELAGLADRTTASLKVDITADRWYSYAAPAAESYDGYDPFYDDEEGYADPYGDDDDGPSYPNAASYPTYPTYPGYPSYWLAQTGSNAKFMNDELCDQVQRLGLAIQIVPKGDTAQALKFGAVFDEPKPIGGQLQATHMRMDASMPGMAMDGDVRMDERGQTLMTGAMQLANGPGASETFQWSLGGDARAQTLEVAHPASQIRFKLVATATGTSTAAMYNMEDGSKLADVEAEPGQANTLLLKYTDGSLARWAPFSGAPATMIGTPKPTIGAPGPTPTPTRSFKPLI